MDAVTAIKKIVLEVLENEKQSDLMHATYTGAGLKIDNKPNEIGLDMTDIPQHLQTITGLLSCDLSEGFEMKAKDSTGQYITVESIKLTNVPVTIKTGLAVGDKVAVMQQKGAQKYFIIGRAST